MFQKNGLPRSPQSSQSYLKMLIQMVKSQQEIQKKSLDYFQRSQKRDKQMIEILKGLRSDFTTYYHQQKEYNNKNIKMQSLRNDYAKSSLSELVNFNKLNIYNSQQEPTHSMNFIKIDEKIIDHNHESNNKKQEQSEKSCPKFKHANSLVRRSSSKRNYNETENEQPKVIQKYKFKEKEILIPFYEDKFISYYDYKKFKQKIAIWTGELYSELSEITYTRYSKKQFTKDQMKVFFTSNVILNSVRFMNFLIQKYPYLWKMHKKQILQQYDLQSKNTLKYLMRKYPMKKRGVIDYSLEQIIKQQNHMLDPEFDSLRNSEIYFEFNNQKQYCDKIKIVMNVFTRLTMKNFKNFRKQLQKIFTIQIQIQQNPLQHQQNLNNSYLANSKIGPQISTYAYQQFGNQNTELNHGSNLFINNYMPNLTNTTFLRESTLKRNINNLNPVYGHTKEVQVINRIIKHQIGMKFKENSPLYTSQQIKQKGIKIKTPQILRIIMKWIQVLQKKITNYHQTITNNEFLFSNKDKQHGPVELNINEKELLKQKLKQSIQKLYSYRQQGNTSEIRLALSQLSNFIDKNKHQFYFIPQNQAIVGLSTYILSDPVSKLTISYLQSLIHCLLEAQTNFNNQSKKNPISLLQFGVFDLLRARCSGNKHQIQEVYKNLIESKVFKIVRVKNRLQSVNRDFLINMKYSNTPLICELQLSIVNEKEQEEQKHKTLNLFSHFLYELQRSKYGPLTEAVITNNHLNSTISYFEDEMKNISINTLNIKSHYNKQKKIIQIEGYEINKIDISFTCNNCWKFKYTNQSFLSSFEQIVIKGNKENNKKICGLCAFLRLSREEKKGYLLQELADIFEQLRLDELKKLKRNENYICIITHGIKKNLKIFQKIDSEQQNKILFSQTFFTYNYPCQIYDIDDLNIAYAFKLKDNLNFIVKEGRQIIQNKSNYLFSHSEISIKQIDMFICCKLTKTNFIVLDKEYNKQEIMFKIQQTKNLKHLIDYLKYDSNHNKTIKQKLKQINNCEILTLKGSKLLSIEFIISKTLKTLNISENNIKNIEFSKFHFENMTELNISSNQLSKINLNKSNLSKLKILNLRNNLISQIFLLESKLTSLNQLNLACNQINQSFLSEIVNLSNLSDLNLSENKFEILNLANIKLSLLTNFNISYNKIKSITNLNSFVKLQTFDASNNFLISMDFTNSQLKYLKKVDLSSNRLTNITGLEELQGLKQLYLSYNYLEKFDLSSLPDTKLQKFHISFNKLQSLTYDKSKLKTIKEFYIERNRLKQFKEERSLSSRISAFRLYDKKSNSQYNQVEIMNIFNWILNYLNKQNVENVMREIQKKQGKKQDQIQGQIQNKILNLPFIRYKNVQIGQIREIVSKLMPDDNAIAIPSPGNMMKKGPFGQ